MSDKPKKQFKSQSVNDLFRQSSSSSWNSSDENGSTTHTLRKSSSQGNTKLKLVSRKIRTKRSSASPSPSPVTSTDSSKQTTRAPSMEFTVNIPQTTTDTTTTITTTTTTTTTAKSHEPSPSRPLTSRFNWEEDPIDQRPRASLTSRIEVHTNPSSASLLRSQESQDPESPMSWSSPNSKISSFRKSVTTPAINQSPLSRPVESPLFSLTSRQNSEIIPRHIVDDQFWKSPNIWNNNAVDERQLSTKSDSAIPWSPFDIDSLSLDDPFAQQRQSLQHRPPSLELLNRNNSATSRFFPSPIVDQENQFQDTPIQPTPSVALFRSPFQDTSPIFNSFNPIQSFQQQESYGQYEEEGEEEELIPRELVSRTMDLETTIFESHFKKVEDVPISMVHLTKDQSNTTFSKKSSDIELPHYPEGFSSTFYKRGSNNFMFIRELQPKIMTSKYSDMVEVRIILPIQESNKTELQTQLVEIDKREFEGRASVSKQSKQNGHHGSSYHHNGHYGQYHHGYSRKTFVNSKTYNRKK